MTDIEAIIDRCLTIQPQHRDEEKAHLRAMMRLAITEYVKEQAHYDLEKMSYDHQDPKLNSKFMWAVSPEGFEYWQSQFIEGITPEGQAKLDAMQEQWERENGA